MAVASGFAWAAIGTETDGSITCPASLNGIVGFELPIHRIEGEWKVSQNRTDEDKRGVVEGLAVLNTPESLTMKNLVMDRS